MKVYWRKTWHQDGFTEVSESEDERTQRQQAIDFAAAQEPTIGTGGNNDIQWAWTDFFSEVPKEAEVCSVEADGTKYDEWFDI